jgi:hypothetical protein
MSLKKLCAVAAVTGLMAAGASHAATQSDASARADGAPTAVATADDQGGGGGETPGISRPAPQNNPTDLFSTREGFNADGRPKPAFEVQLPLYLPAVSASIGLNRAPNTDIIVNRPRPTIAELIDKLNFAITCECTVRYGDWVGEVSVLYVEARQTTKTLPLPPVVPAAVLKTKVNTLYISPGIGYRLFRSDHVSLDARAGFTYAELDVNSDFEAGQFARSGSYRPSFVQGWFGERIDYYPSPHWRIENTAQVTTALGQEKVGWDAKLAVSYLFNRWVDVTLGYRGSQFSHSGEPAANGALRNVSVLLYGPLFAVGVRF